MVLSGIPRLLKGLEKLGLPSATDRILVEIGRFCAKLKEIHFEVRACLFFSGEKVICFQSVFVVTIVSPSMYIFL